MLSSLRSAYFSNIKGDLFGGLTAAVVALPLALAFGVASGLGPIAGLYGAIATGFFAALFGGTPAQITGPTGPMTVVMAAVVASHASNLPEAFAIVVLGGLFQIVFGVAGFGRYIAYTPYSVVSGFMTGIGIIIVILQTLPFFGLPSAEGGTIGALRALIEAIPAGISPAAMALATLSLLIAAIWPAALRRFLPSPLAALIIGSAVSIAMLPDVPTIGEVPSGLPALAIPGFSLIDLGGVVYAAFVLALLGSIDSLLTSLVADSITRTPHNANRELLGQGLGNAIAGLIGGLPGAGATMRTVINVRAGGRTPLSGAIHALVLLAVALGLGPVAAKIPHAVLAGILMKVGWDIVDWGYVKRIARVPREKAAVMIATLLLTVFIDLITAVGVGVILAFFVNARALESEQMKGVRHHIGADEEEDPLTEAERAKLRQGGGKVILTRLKGTFSHASARELARRVGLRHTGIRVVIYDFAEASYIDPSAAQSIDSLLEQTKADGRTVLISGLRGAAEQALAAFDVLGRIAPSHRFANHAEAIDAALRILSEIEGVGSKS